MKLIYAIPGLGTDENLFKHIRIEGVTIKVLEWPKTKGIKSLEDYAKEFAKQINPSTPFYLMGVSFGGMICTELTKILHPKKTFIISSNKTRHELPYFLKVFRYLPLHRILTDQMHRRLAAGGRWFLGFKRSYMKEFMRMINKMPPHYFRDSIDFIVNWKNEEIPQHLIHIHGDADRLLFYNLVKADYTIHDGSHAMIISKPHQLIQVLKKEMDLD